MIDADLRDLERRWRSTGAVEDEGALLRARLQTGALALDRLELAAWLGHHGARAALGDAAPAGDAFRVADLRGEAGFRQALVASAALALEPLLPRISSAPFRDAVGAWLSDPCAESARAVDAQLGPALAADPTNARAIDDTVVASFVTAGAARLLEGGFDSDDLRALASRPPGCAAPLSGWALGQAHAAGHAPTTIQDEARWLLVLVARGRLSAAKLRLADLGGHPAAGEALAGERALARPPRRWIESIACCDGDGRASSEAAWAAIPWGALSRMAAAEGAQITTEVIERAQGRLVLDRGRFREEAPERRAHRAAALREEADRLRAAAPDLSRALDGVASALVARDAVEASLALLALLPLGGEDVIDAAKRSLVRSALRLDEER